MTNDIEDFVQVDVGPHPSSGQFVPGGFRELSWASSCTIRCRDSLSTNSIACCRDAVMFVGWGFKVDNLNGKIDGGDEGALCKTFGSIDVSFCIFSVFAVSLGC